MFYIALLLKMSLFHQPISAFLLFPRGLAPKEICWSLPDYIHELSIFRITLLFFCVLIHNKFSSFFFLFSFLNFIFVVVLFSSESNFFLLQQLCVLENILFLVFYCMFDEKIILLSLPVKTNVVLCFQRKKCFSIVRNKLLNSDQKFLNNPYPLYLISTDQLHISLSLVDKYLVEVSS